MYIGQNDLMVRAFRGCVVWLEPAAEGNIDSREDKRFRVGARYVVTVGKGHAGAADGYGDRAMTRFTSAFCLGDEG